MPRKIEVDSIRELSLIPGETHWRAVVVNSRDLCYSAVYAGDKPSPEKVLSDYREDKGHRNFTPYYAY